MEKNKLKKEKQKSEWENEIEKTVGDQVDEYTKKIMKLYLYNDLIDDVQEFLVKLTKELGKEKVKNISKILKELQNDITKIIQDKIDNVDLSKVFILDENGNDCVERDENVFDNEDDCEEESEFLEEMKS